jgi:flagellar basal body rod protein FlgG
MKRIIVLLLLTSFVFIGCKDKPKDLLVKKWRVTDISIPGQVLPDSIKNNIKQGTMEFTKDGKLSLTGMGMGGDKSGTYTLSEDGKTLTVVTNGQSEVNDVTELSKSKLVIHDKANNSTLTAEPR